MSVVMFPGQGSQKLGMGDDLFSKYPDIVQEANDVLGYSIESLCLEDGE
jgi:trans-AT polyketide synthase/acyltransferase/oxidoreductase domain-containing protein